MVKPREVGVITGFDVSQNGEAISHLQFADDTILFRSAKRDEILALKKNFEVIFVGVRSEG